MAQIFIGIAALIHVYIFALESLLWGRPRTNRAFGLSSEVAEHNRLFAFNQGYYNLFLALAAGIGMGCVLGGLATVGVTLMAYAALSMLAASLVLFVSQKKLFRAALIQGLPPLLGLVALAIALRS